MACALFPTATSRFPHDVPGHAGTTRRAAHRNRAHGMRPDNEPRFGPRQEHAYAG